MTSQQRDVIELMDRGMTSGQIAKRLGISERAAAGCMYRLRHDIDADESRSTVDRRIARDIREGRRCERCHLLLPCGGHSYEFTRNWHDPREWAT